MKITLSLLLSLSMSATFASEWTYSGEHGAAHWADLSPEYASCAGKAQSPINLTGFSDVDLPDLQFNYQAGGAEFLNNGHTTQVNYQAGSTIQVDGKSFELKQFHFHAPSENHINGKSFPMEMHLVHKTAEGEVAVVALMFAPTPRHVNNVFIDKLWANMPKKSGDSNTLDPALNVGELLPKNRDYYRFEGSLTTPPCSEGLHWLVLKNPVPLSKAQWKYFAKIIGTPNNRPIQALNGRVVQE